MTINDEFPFMNMDEKIQLQLERLQSTLNRAYRNVPFHKKRFKDMDIDISEIEQVIRSCPPAVHGTAPYQRQLSLQPVCGSPAGHRQNPSTPGTTYKPTVSGYTPQDLSILATHSDPSPEGYSV